MGIKITTIEVGNLPPADVKSLIADALRMEDDEDYVSFLATTIHRKTEGNPFFVLAFLRSLHDEGLIEFNFGVMR